MTNRLPVHDRAFTLVELLVVVGIIGLLVSILMPSLQKARRAANTAACLSNLRQLGLAMTIYATENKGTIVGAGMTSGRHAWKLSAGPGAVVNNPPYSGINNIADVNEPLDWAGPLAKVMGLKDPSLTSLDGRERFKFYVRAMQFRCPQYEGMIMSNNAGTDLGAQPAFSYNTALAFLNVPNSNYPGTTAGDGLAGNVCLPGSPYWTAPGGYFPKVTKVGSASRKIFMADGARRSRPFGATAYQIQYTLTSSPSTLNTNETMYADYGAFCGNTRSYSRGGISGNASPTPTIDLRWLSFRHGTSTQFAPSGLYRMNMVFYDGHAETMEDMQAANPNLWLPRGSTIANPDAASGTPDGSKIIYTDVKNKYNITAGWVAD